MAAVATEGLKKVAGYTCQDLANSATWHSIRFSNHGNLYEFVSSYGVVLMVRKD